MALAFWELFFFATGEDFFLDGLLTCGSFFEELLDFELEPLAVFSAEPEADLEEEALLLFDTPVFANAAADLLFLEADFFPGLATDAEVELFADFFFACVMPDLLFAYLSFARSAAAKF